MEYLLLIMFKPVYSGNNSIPTVQEIRFGNIEDCRSVGKIVNDFYKDGQQYQIKLVCKQISS